MKSAVKISPASWAPTFIVDLLNDFKNRSEQISESYISKIEPIWLRLATRPEMENFWAWYSETRQFEPFERFGLVQELGMAIERFDSLPKLSTAAYKSEMLELADLASTLNAKLLRFTDYTELGGNPFNRLHLPYSEWSEQHARLGSPELRDLYYDVTHKFPSIAEHLELLISAARVESEDQTHRLDVSRKASGFRAYFIRTAAGHFAYLHTAYSASKVATFCSVALDDPDITADLVRKLFTISAER